MHKILVSIGAFFQQAVEGIETFFKNTIQAIGKWVKGEETKLQPLFDALLAELQILLKEAVTTATTALIAAGKILLTDLIAAL